MAILAPLFSISAFSTTRLAFRKFSVRSVLPACYLLAGYTEVRILFGEQPLCFLVRFPLIFLHRRDFFQEDTL